MPQTQSSLGEPLDERGTKIGRNNNIPGTNALIIGNSNNAFSEENLILGDFNSAAGKSLIVGDQNITSDSKNPIFVIGNNNTTPPNSNGIIAGNFMTFSKIFENGYVFGADGLYQTYSIDDFMIFGPPTATQSFTHSGRVYINWDVEFGPDSNVIGLTGSLIGAAGPQGFQGPFGGPQGPQGLVGNTGSQGTQGNIGNTGVQGGVGIQGPQGRTGVQGNVGPQGLLGLQGTQGFQGNTGSQGPQGLLGLTGNQGVMGPTGVGGALGYYGSYYSSLTQLNPTASVPNTIRQNELYYQNGLISNNIDTITFLNSGVYDIQLTTTIFKPTSDIQEVNFWISKNGITLTQSNSKVNFPHLEFTLNYSNNWIVDCNVNDYIQLYWSSDDTSIILQSYGATGSIPFTPSSTLNISQIMYTQLGPTGSNGLNGVTGSQGFQGAIGLTGAQGDFGPTGVQGNTGPQGPIGNTGSDGTIGVDGNTGPQGFQGNIGPSGSNGSQGFQGPQGLTGPQGALSSDKGSIGVIFDGFGGVPIVGKTDWIVVPYNGTITGWQIFGGTTGSCVIDVRKDTYGNFPPTAADSIAGTQKPTLITQIKNQDLSLSSWTSSVTSGDIIQFYLESASLLTKINCVIFIDKN